MPFSWHDLDWFAFAEDGGDNFNWKWIGILLLSAAGIFLLVVSGVAATATIRDARSTGWPTAQGEVLRSSVEQATRTFSDRDWLQPWQTSVYTCLVDYRYEVDGRAFESDQVMASGRAIDHTNNYAARRWIEAFPEGASIKVFYNPGNPSHRALIQGAAPGAWLTVVLFALGGVLCLGGAYALYRWGTD